MALNLFWSDPLGASTNDYDVFVLDSGFTTVLRSSTTRQSGTQDPYESIETLNAGERIVIVKYSGAPRFLHLETGGLSINTSGATAGHSAGISSSCPARCRASSFIMTAALEPTTFGPRSQIQSFEERVAPNRTMEFVPRSDVVR